MCSELPQQVLAYVGDVVFSSYVRLRFLPESGQVRILHDLTAKMVSAVCQAKAMQSLVSELTEEEEGVYHRGRNAKMLISSLLNLMTALK